MDFLFVSIMSFLVTLLRVVTTLIRPFSEWILNVLYWLVVGRTRKLPPIDNPILLSSATELASKIRKKELTAEEVMTAFVDRCRSIQPIINAYVDERFEQALAEARSMDRWMATGAKSEDEIARELPLLGVPFSCKEAVGIRGLAQTAGIYDEKDRIAPKDSDAAELYRRAGGIPYLVTNVPEFTMWWETANIAFGWTKNPYDKRRTVGGSSGGEAALISSCGAVIGIGSDLAGSIRIPASFCGIYGHKPSSDLISNYGSFSPDYPDPEPLLCTGPMCRYVEDLNLLTRILSIPNASKVSWNRTVDFRKMKVFYMEQFPGWLLSATSDIKAAVLKAARHFEENYGSTTTRLCIPELKYAFCISDCKLLETGISPSFKNILKLRGHCSLTWEFIKSLFRASKHTWPALYFAAIERRKKGKFYYRCLDMFNEIKNKLEENLEGDAILLLPTHPDPPPHYLMTIPKYPNIAYTCIFNALGYPSTQIPAGMSRGLPIGIQAISTQYKDNLTLAVARELDKVFGGWINPSPVELENKNQ